MQVLVIILVYNNFSGNKVCGIGLPVKTNEKMYLNAPVKPAPSFFSVPLTAVADLAHNGKWSALMKRFSSGTQSAFTVLLIHPFEHTNTELGDQCLVQAHFDM